MRNILLKVSQGAERVGQGLRTGRSVGACGCHRGWYALLWTCARQGDGNALGTALYPRPQ